MFRSLSSLCAGPVPDALCHSLHRKHAGERRCEVQFSRPKSTQTVYADSRMPTTVWHASSPLCMPPWPPWTRLPSIEASVVLSILRPSPSPCHLILSRTHLVMYLLSVVCTATNSSGGSGVGGPGGSSSRVCNQLSPWRHTVPARVPVTKGRHGVLALAVGYCP